MRKKLMLGGITAATTIAPITGCTFKVLDPDRGPAAGVTAANPQAVEAGLTVLRAGGSAVDAAVAVQAMLGLVEPQSSGLGGGAFLMHYEAATGKVTMFDGRETAPAAATPEMFLDGAGNPVRNATMTGRATGVPGVMPMLGVAHARFGVLPWNELFGTVIAAADTGFLIAPRLGRFVNGSGEKANAPDVRALFSRPDGTPVQIGDLHRNPDYAATLRALASRGARALHEGPIAEAIVAKVNEEPLPAGMTLADLAGYEPVEREPLCAPWHGYRICVPPPPSSGVGVLQLLGMLEHTDIASRGPDDPRAWFLFAEGSRIMYADRDRYIGDPGFVNVPVAGLLDPGYVAERARLIGDSAGAPPEAGMPTGIAFGPDATDEIGGTSHFVVVDSRGNVVSMTTTVESLFGSARAVGGFLLNNEMTDFSFVPVVDGMPVANAVAAGKRPRSSMLPTIILDQDGSFRGAIGSPGGNAILAYNSKLLVGLLAWKLGMQEAIDLPNLIARGSSFAGEASKFAPGVVDALRAKGVEVRPGSGEDSGLHGVIVRRDGTTDGGADSRRDGVWRRLEGN